MFNYQRCSINQTQLYFTILITVFATFGKLIFMPILCKVCDSELWCRLRRTHHVEMSAAISYGIALPQSVVLSLQWWRNDSIELCRPTGCVFGQALARVSPIWFALLIQVCIYLLVKCLLKWSTRTNEVWQLCGNTALTIWRVSLQKSHFYLNILWNVLVI